MGIAQGHYSNYSIFFLLPEGWLAGRAQRATSQQHPRHLVFIPGDACYLLPINLTNYLFASVEIVCWLVGERPICYNLSTAGTTPV